VGSNPTLSARLSLEKGNIGGSRSGISGNKSENQPTFANGFANEGRNQMPERTRKIALIGADGYVRRSDDYRVDCFPWNKVKGLANIQDYDVLIINLLTPRRAETSDWAEFNNVMNRPAVMTLLDSEGQIVVVGDPRFTIPLDVEKRTFTDFLSWSCLHFSWDDKPGDTVHISDYPIHSNFIPYLRNLKHWDYSLNRCDVDFDAYGQVYDVAEGRKRGLQVSVETDVFCSNRVNKAIAFSVRFVIGIERPGDYIEPRRTETIKRFGPITFLPKITDDHDQTIMLVLRDVCGIDSAIPEPIWLNKFEAPGQKEIEEEIDEIRAKVAESVTELDSAMKRRNEARSCLGLLYERGDALERITWYILSELGGTVEAPQDPGKEDGWVEVDAQGEQLEMVLEIKSTKNDQFGEDGFKQLLEWRSRGVTLRNKEYKGVFIGSSCINKPPEERPFAFSDNAMKMAKLHHLAAIKTEDLYIVYILNKAGRCDTKAFWHALFHTDGVFDINAFVEQSDAGQD
jgi:hypothetical protein